MLPFFGGMLFQGEPDNFRGWWNKHSGDIIEFRDRDEYRNSTIQSTYEWCAL